MMTSISRFVVAGLLFALSLGTPFRTVADEKEKENSAEAPVKSGAAAQEKKQSRFPFRGKVAAVDTAAKTITLAGKEKNRTIHITAQTKIIKSDKAANLEDAAVGDQVAGQVSRTADGKEEALSLRIGPKALLGRLYLAALA